MGASFLRISATTATVLASLIFAGTDSDAATFNIPIDPSGSHTIVTIAGSLAAAQELDFVLKLNGDFAANPGLEISGLVQIDFSNGVTLLADGLSTPVTSDTTENVLDIAGILGNTTHFKINVSPSDVASVLTLDILAVLDSINGGFAATMSVELPDSLSATVTPIPGALPLFASGFGVLGYLGWRRKQAKSH